MRLAESQLGIVLVLASLLQACGGGGNSPAGSAPHVTATPTAISVSATPGDEQPRRTVALVVTNLPANGFFVREDFSIAGLETVVFAATSASQGVLTVAFRSPGSLQNDTYLDTIQVRVCTDQQCTSQIAGSPISITTTYVVSGTGPSTASLAPESIQVVANANESHPRTGTVRVTLSTAPVSPINVQVGFSTNAIFTINQERLSGTIVDVHVAFRPTEQLGHGTFNDTVALAVCYDGSCVRQAQGSPFTVSSAFTVGAAPEPGVTPLPVTSRVALPHDVIDAEFSKSLSQVVMVGQYPTDALYVYDVATAIERRQLLSRTPTAVSVSPDGLTAAVGHDSLISIVDLTTVGQPGAPTPTLLDVDTDVYDVVLAGNGFVHATARAGQWGVIHTVHIATNTEQLSSGAPIYEKARGRLHPSGDFLYTANTVFLPSDIEKWDVTASVAAWLYDSPYDGEFQMCGNLWFSENGLSIYTACGNALQSNTVREQDMVFSGALQLAPSVEPFRVQSLSHSAALNEIALIEYDHWHCDNIQSQSPCFHHMVFFDSTFLGRLAVYAIGPGMVNNVAFAERGMFVFHDAANTNKYLLSKLFGMANPDAEYYLSVVP